MLAQIGELGFLLASVGLQGKSVTEFVRLAHRVGHRLQLGAEPPWIAGVKRLLPVQAHANRQATGIADLPLEMQK